MYIEQALFTTLLVLLMYIDNVYVLCFNIKVRLEQFLSVTCTGYITYTMIGFMFIFEASITSYFTCTLTEIMFYVLTYHQRDSISSCKLYVQVVRLYVH